MTAVATSPVVTSPARRIALASRLHATNPWGTLILPWMITVAIFALNLSIWLILRSTIDPAKLETDAFQTNGGVTWLFFYMTVVAVQAMNQTFRFAVGMSATRRDYYVGTALYFALLSVMYAVGITALAAVERATDGWGVGGAFFAPAFLSDLALPQLSYVYLVSLLCAFFVGSAVASVYVRWGSTGIVAFFIALGVLFVGGIWAMTEAQAWTSFWETLASHSVPWIVSWLLIPAALGVAVGYALMRRATPRA